MVEYIKSIIIMGTVSSLVVMALPSESEKVGKYVKYLSVLMLLAVMFSPLAGISGFVASVAEIFDDGTADNSTADSDASAEAVISQTAENLSEYIMNICRDKFGQKKDSLKVKLILDERDAENVVIDEIQIFTRELDRGEREKIAEYFKELLQTDVFVFGT